MKALRAEEKRLLAADGTEIAYRVIGQGAPIVLAGGLGAGWLAWKHQIEYLSDRYRFITWDYRGLFSSGSPLDTKALSIADHALDGLRVMEQEGIERAAVIGWSLGVHVALEMFARQAQRFAALVLIGGAPAFRGSGALGGGLIARGLPSLFREKGVTTVLLENAIRAAVGSPEAFTWARRLGVVGRNLGQREFADLVAGLGDLDYGTYASVLHRMLDHDGSAVLADIDIPTLAILGGRDPFTARSAVESMVQQIPGAEFLVVPNGTHFVLLDHPEHVSLRIEKFFRERGYGSPS